ncbi:MAG: hypothetical protein H6817_03990 [Phycisphaerales bacterium]|nr:hypothetical protein [Phycisphaerales bacterium]
MVFVMLPAVGVARAADFASEVVSCVPAPGQFVNNATFNEPGRVLGPPSGGGTSTPDNTSALSLGGFGGSVVVRFDHTVRDDPGNYLGLDFIVYGNATWVSNDPQRHWAEPAHVEIMRDVNSDGLPGTHPDEVWYLVPGSMTTNGAGYRAQTWDNVAGGPYPPSNPNWFPFAGVYPYLPEGPCAIPLDEAGRYTTEAFEVSALLYSNPSGQGGALGVVVNPNFGDSDPENDHLEGRWGYAEFSPTLRLGDFDGDNVVDDPEADADVFYTMPDNPYRVGVTPGSGGGDAFDIAWAVDPDTWQPANLDGCDFVRITSAVDLVLGPLGEASPEIDAVADVKPVACPGDLDADGTVTLVDLLRLRNLRDVEDPDPAFSIVGDVRNDGVLDLGDLAVLRATYLGATCE